MTSEPIRAFCIDFNWDRLNRFSSPGLYSSADPREHFEWYQRLGANTVQSFYVTHNGYAWYRSDIAPTTPGPGARFFEQLATISADAGMRVMGYFSPGASLSWHKQHPDLSRDLPGRHHIPFTEQYIDYFGSLLNEALDRVPVDGFMIDWLWNPDPIWTPVERQLFRELFGEEFPEAPPTQDVVDEYGRRAVQRMWDRIRLVGKSANPETIVWLSCNDLENTQVRDTSVIREADWLMNENPNMDTLTMAWAAKGEKSELIQCVCGWGEDHDASAAFTDGTPETGIYGFARPDEITTLPDMTDPGNARNIRTMHSHFHQQQTE